VPVLLEEGGWRPTGWLGLVVAGSLWTPLVDREFDVGVGAVVQQIKKSVPVDEIADDFDAGTGSEIRAELARLRADLEAGKSSGGAAATDGEFTAFDSTQPAVLPSNVPALPVDYEETEAVVDLRKLLLQQQTDPKWKQRVGFFGAHKLTINSQ
jgi:hypothetical protein